LLKHTLVREDERGKKRGATMVVGRPLSAMRRGVGDRPRAAPQGDNAWGGGVGLARQSANTAWSAAA
jgi:hypothetical protein